MPGMVAYCFFSVRQKYFDPSLDEIPGSPLPDDWSPNHVLVRARVHRSLLSLRYRLSVCRSLDGFLLQKHHSDASSSSSVPRWNYLLLRIQFFVMYFVAGLKKFEPDWLWGYSMMSLGHHRAFAPFRYACRAHILLADRRTTVHPTICIVCYRYVFSAEFVDHWIVHVGGFLIDLLSGFGLCFRSTRPFTVVVLLAFHGLNSLMFTIGTPPPRPPPPRTYSIRDCAIVVADRTTTTPPPRRVYWFLKLTLATGPRKIISRLVAKTCLIQVHGGGGEEDMIFLLCDIKNGYG